MLPGKSAPADGGTPPFAPRRASRRPKRQPLPCATSERGCDENAASRFSVWCWSGVAPWARVVDCPWRLRADPFCFGRTGWGWPIREVVARCRQGRPGV